MGTSLVHLKQNVHYQMNCEQLSVFLIRNTDPHHFLLDYKAPSIGCLMNCTLVGHWISYIRMGMFTERIGVVIS